MSGELSQPTHEVTLERDVAVEMPDGVSLAVDVTRPDTAEPVPALLTMTAYSKEVEGMAVPPIPFNTGGANMAMVEGTSSEFWARRGFTHVVADVRGCGKSEGAYRHFHSAQEASDGYHLIEWMADQPWCDGKVGMVGISYLGVVQYLVAATQPPHLETIFPQDGWGDAYRDIMYHGGIQSYFSLVLSRSGPQTATATTISEELYGKDELEDRVAELMADDATNVKNSPSLLRRLAVPDVNPLEFDVLVNREDNAFWEERRPAAVMDQIEAATYLGSEMHEYPTSMHLPGAANWGWERINAEKKLAFRPAVPRRPHKVDYHEEMLRWFDHHLKGNDTGLMDEPPVKVWVRNADRYRYADEWPLHEATQWTEFYLRYPDRLIADEPAPSDEPVSVLDYEGVPPGDFKLSVIGGEPDHLTFASAPFETPTEVVGPMALYLYAALSTTDGHFLVAVRDRGPDGDERILSRGWLKASHRAIDKERSERWRPYHPHTNPEPVEPGAIERYAIEVQPIANLFRPGHRLTLEVWPTDYPPDDGLDPTLLGDNILHIPYGEDVTYRLFHDALYPSHLLVPVIQD